MFAQTILKSLVLGLAGLATGTSIPSDASNALAAINNERVNVHDLSPLAWNDDLALAANNWANHLLSTGVIAHADASQRGKQGEVVAHFEATTPDNNFGHPIAAATSNWIVGGASYPAGAVIGDQGTEHWTHWAQLMWSTTTEIGCSAAQSTLNNDFQSFIVCRLFPEGNIIGQAPFTDKHLAARQLETGPFNGDITHFTTGLGACGEDDTGKGGVASLSHILLGPVSNGNPYCGHRVRLEANGRTTYATVKDKCMGCAKEDIDVSEDVFIALYDNLSVGRADVRWTIEA